MNMCFQKDMIEFWKENVICENDNIIWKLYMNACKGPAIRWGLCAQQLKAMREINN
jgi:hypothetical protein